MGKREGGKENLIFGVLPTLHLPGSAYIKGRQSCGEMERKKKRKKGNLRSTVIQRESFSFFVQYPTFFFHTVTRIPQERKKRGREGGERKKKKGKGEKIGGGDGGDRSLSLLRTSTPLISRSSKGGKEGGKKTGKKGRKI